MYPSLPKNEVVAEVIRIKEPELKPNVNKDALIQLVSLSVKFMSFKISNKFYWQTDGLFIDSPSSPCFQKKSPGGVL